MWWDSVEKHFKVRGCLEIITAHPQGASVRNVITLSANCNREPNWVSNAKTAVPAKHATHAATDWNEGRRSA
jgi:hypothetical protein